MNPNWQDFLGANGAHIDRELVADFGNLEAELLAARDGTIVAPLVHLGVLECGGEDAKAFLHNQLTSDVNHLGADAAQHSAWCTAKGRMLASLVLYRREGTYRALLSADLLDTIGARLQKYVLRSRVSIAGRTTDFELIGLSGPHAEAALQAADLPIPAGIMETAASADATVIRLDDARLAVVATADAAPELWRSLAAIARPVGTRAWQWLDVKAGIPLICAATTEAFVPQMANLDKIGGVSFRKGCYPGQEVVARSHYLGKIKRHLYRFHADGPIAAGDLISAPQVAEQSCGMVANAAPAPGGGFDALAVLLERQPESAEPRLQIADRPETELSGIAPVSG